MDSLKVKVSEEALDAACAIMGDLLVYNFSVEKHLAKSLKAQQRTLYRWAAMIDKANAK